MLELLLCSMLTIVPDYLFRRYGQGKRFGHEITLFSVWFELRWGIVTCLMLTVGLITTVFYFHPPPRPSRPSSGRFPSSPRRLGALPKSTSSQVRKSRE